MAKVFRSPVQLLQRNVVGFKRFFASENRKGCKEVKKKSLMTVEDKVVMITGGSSGIGLAIAREMMAQKAKGVVICGVNKQQGEEAASCLNVCEEETKAKFLEMDVRILKTFESVMKKIIDCFGSLDILVNNAGIFEEAKWEQTVSVNINGTVNGVLLAHRFMGQNSDGGLVINVADTYGLEPFPYAPIYSATKYAVIGLTKAFGHPDIYEKTKIRVVALCPAVTQTDMLENKQPMLNKKWEDKAYETLKMSPQQHAKAVGKAANHLIQYAQTGTIWPVECTVLHKVTFPNRISYCNKVIELGFPGTDSSTDCQ
ncbi:development-specific 25 kDa protein-like isoform X1 [Cimex lectularius]|uniref:Alcohol dehydrogenase n=2 Tax=Cimex lectularius TaxID=79782 RepID=A0A8I6SF20_CIMLE|nr:development-specific 25 kDa protein-like isoform X1 [Cimex lectularius]